jgi:Flp pilus assembly protein TadB
VEIATSFNQMLVHAHATFDWSDPAIAVPVIAAVASVLVALITAAGSVLSVWLYWWLRQRKRNDAPKKKLKPAAKTKRKCRPRKGG